MSRMLWSVAVVLLIVWLAVWLVFKVASGLVHLILLIAITVVIVNVVQRLRARG
jgi:hypothetical protein